ncbi:MAG: hypothetical protein ACT4OV_01385, partial [Microthrixaceae bacterium]
ACRADLLAIDGRAVPLRLTRVGTALDVSACVPVTLTAGSHRVTSAPGSRTGIDLDRLVLSSGPDGRPATLAARGTQADRSGATVRVRQGSSSRLDLVVRTDGRPFWLVLGQSSSSGWKASTAEGSLGGRRLVDGYANGWLVTPTSAGTMSISLTWGPQRLLPVGIVVSSVALLACLVILWRGRGRSHERLDSGLAARPVLRLTAAASPPPAPRALGAAAVAAIAALLVVPPAAAVGGALAVLVGRRVRHGASLMALVAVSAVAVSRVGHRPALAWLAVVILAVDVLWRERAELSRG